MPDQKIQQVHFPQLVVPIPMFPARSDEVLDLAWEPPDGSPIRRVVITVDPSPRYRPQRYFQQLSHVLSDGFRVGSTKTGFQLLALLFLSWRHPALTSQLTVGEVNEEIRSFFYSHVVVEWKVLTELKGFEAVDDNFGCTGSILHQFCMQ